MFLTEKRKLATMHRKRVGERRRYSPARIYPIIDSDGGVIAVNRSHTPDRRLDNYQLAEIDLPEIALTTANEGR